jgi:hypothetical protein
MMKMLLICLLFVLPNCTFALVAEKSRGTSQFMLPRSEMPSEKPNEAEVQIFSGERFELAKSKFIGRLEMLKSDTHWKVDILDFTVHFDSSYTFIARGRVIWTVDDAKLEGFEMVWVDYRDAPGGLGKLAK